VWTVRNTVTPQFQTGSATPLLVREATGNALVTGRDMNGTTYGALMRADGSTQDTWTLLGGNGRGRELHGTAGADGLHVIYRDANPANVVHLSSATGGPWVFEGMPFPAASTDLDLGSTRNGEVYASFVNVNSAELHYWNGAAWAVQQAYPAQAGYRPDIMDQPLGDELNWAVYIPVVDTIRYVKGSQTVPFAFTAVVGPEMSPVWDLNVSGGIFEGVNALAGGVAAINGRTGSYNWDGGAWELFFPSSTGFTGYAGTWGRTMANSVQLSPGYLGFSAPTWFAHNLVGETLRIERTLIGEVITSFPQTLSDRESDPHRTVSAGFAWGGAASIGLICDFYGREPILEWGDFGLWENLKLPAGLDDASGAFMSCPQLIVGMDGRWHIVYHDLASDEIRCWSTLE
jgi:hypothetical protein